MVSLLSVSQREENSKKLTYLNQFVNTLNSEYFDILQKIPFSSIIIEDGSDCYPQCKICCYRDGSKKKTQSSKKLFETIMKQIPETEIESLFLTDGEPFQNKKRLEKIVKITKKLPLDIYSSGFFATNVKAATEVLTGIKEAGFTTNAVPRRSFKGQDHNLLSISADEYHLNSFSTARNFVKAFDKVFDEKVSIEDLFSGEFYTPHHLMITTTYDGEQKKPHELNSIRDELIEPLKKSFDGKYITFGNPGEGYLILGDLVVLLRSRVLRPWGKAKNIMEEKPRREFNPKDIECPINLLPQLYLTSTGDLYHAIDYVCLAPGRKMGNIYEGPLNELISDFKKTPIFKMERQGGVKGVYSWLYKNGVRLSGTIDCDVCKQIYGDATFINDLNKKLEN